jgi:hypothetical protein
MAMALANACCLPQRMPTAPFGCFGPDPTAQVTTIVATHVAVVAGAALRLYRMNCYPTLAAVQAAATAAAAEEMRCFRTLCHPLRECGNLQGVVPEGVSWVRVDEQLQPMSSSLLEHKRTHIISLQTLSFTCVNNAPLYFILI